MELLVGLESKTDNQIWERKNSFLITPERDVDRYVGYTAPVKQSKSFKNPLIL